MNSIAKKELLKHFLVVFFVFFLISLAKHWFEISYYVFWLGGIVGVLLPDIDHFIYVFSRPHEVTSRRVTAMLGRKDYKNTYSLLSETKSERNNLIIHTALFQLIFLVLTFLVITSSGSYFGRGLVIAFSIRLLSEQYSDYKNNGNIQNWFINFPFIIRQDKQILFWLGVFGLTMFFGFIF